MIELPERWAVHEGEAVALLRELPTASVDALVTDHPYSSGGMTRGDRSQGTKSKYVQTGSSSHELEDFSGDTRDQRSYELWCALWLSEALRATKPGGVGLLFCDWRQLASTIDAFQVGGWVFRGVVPWAKPTSRPQKGRFAAACEFVVWGSNGPMPADRGVGVLPGFYTYTPPRVREHITQKPVPLMVDLLEIVPAGGLVLDPFCGNGTTGVAAVQTGRRFLGCELVPAHAATARARIARAGGERVDAGSQLAIV